MCQIKLLITSILLLSLTCFVVQAEDTGEFEEKYYPIVYLKSDPSSFFLADEIDIRTSLNFKRAVLDVGVPEELFLNSNGGLVYIGLDLALEVERLKITTIIPSDFGCYSACAYVFLAGAERIADGELGVHQISGGDNDLIVGQITIGDVIDVLNQFETPPEIYPMMFSAKPDEMYILSSKELYNLGLQGVRKSSGADAQIKPVQLGETALETAALEFVGMAMDLSSGFGNENLTFILSLYAKDVDYYGNDWSVRNIRADKVSFFDRWPQRNYALDLDRSQAICISKQRCVVTGLVRWSVSSPERNKETSGEARFEYSLALTGGKFSITRESSRVVKRNN